MSAASLAAAVPPRPIATPMSAWRSAGASLTPSPVTATTSPSRLQRADEPQLVLRRDARVDVGVAAARAARLVEPLELGAGHRRALGEAERRADRHARCAGGRR